MPASQIRKCRHSSSAPAGHLPPGGRYWPANLQFHDQLIKADNLNWNLTNSRSLRRVDRRLLPWQSPSNSRTRNVIHRRGAHLERPAEKFLIFRFLSAKRCYLTEIFAKTHGTIPSGTQRRNDNTPGPSRLVSRHCRPRLGPGPCPAGAQDERPYEV